MVSGLEPFLVSAFASEGPGKTALLPDATISSQRNVLTILSVFENNNPSSLRAQRSNPTQSACIGPEAPRTGATRAVQLEKAVSRTNRGLLRSARNDGACCSKFENGPCKNSQESTRFREEPVACFVQQIAGYMRGPGNTANR
jgi:hypothetical protein